MDQEQQTIRGRVLRVIRGLLRPSREALDANTTLNTGFLIVLAGLVILAVLYVVTLLVFSGNSTSGNAALSTLAAMGAITGVIGSVVAGYYGVQARLYGTERQVSNSANLTLQLDNRFNSDRALRIRHGAVRFLAEKRNVPIHCEYDISPYRTDPSNRWYGLPSDLIDLFNYFDWIGYLTSEESNAIDREVVRQKFGPWIIAYYDMCRPEIDAVQEQRPDHWLYLEPLYEDLVKRRMKWYADNRKALPIFADEKELNAFLLREHVRSHRGFHPLPSTTLRE